MKRIGMISRSISRLSIVVAVATVAGCASARPPGSTTAAAAGISAGDGSMRTEATSHCYTGADIARIEMMREEGRTVAEVIKVVGGTGADLREMEQRLRVSRRESRRAAALLGAPCGQVTLAP
jgi:hypothetical protein